MCRLYGFRATEPTKVECTLVHAQNALMVQSRADLSGKSHASGWGVATYENGAPHVERQAWAAYHGEHFQRTAARIYAREVLAHVRRATVGAPDLVNTHPFTDGCWAFAHNGTVPHFTRLRPIILDQLPRARQGLIHGETDSEHIFHLVRHWQTCSPDRAAHAVVRDAVEWVVSECRKIDPAAKVGLNLMLTDGREMVGTRLGRPLFLVERDGVHDCEICGFPHVHHDPRANYRAIVLASEPISHEAWVEVADASLYHVDPDCRIVFERLEVEPG